MILGPVTHCDHDPPQAGCRRCHLARTSGEYQRLVGLPVTVPDRRPTGPPPDLPPAPTIAHDKTSAGEVRRAAPVIPCGDWAAAVIKVVGAERLHRWWSKQTAGCGACDERRRRMNDACTKLEKWARRLTGGVQG